MSRAENHNLAQYATQLGLTYTPAAIRNLRSRHGDTEARHHIERTAALLALADLISSPDAPLTITQQAAEQTLRRTSGNYEKAAAHIQRRARAAASAAERLYHTELNKAWAEIYAKEANTRHAVLTGTYEVMAGSTGRVFTALMSLLAEADLDTVRERLRIKATRLVTHALNARFPHPGDQDAKQYVLRRAPDLAQRIDLIAHDRGGRQFRGDMQDVIAEGAEALAELGAREGWQPDASRPGVVRAIASRRAAARRKNPRKAA